MTRVKLSSIIFFLVMMTFGAKAGGVKGNIRAEDGTPLAYATIFVKQTGTGAATDLDGNYEVQLPPGQYDILFQFLGYETVTRSLNIANEFVTIDLTLKSQSVILETVTIRAGKEDPAYTVMRKAIAKAKYHTQQIDTYSAKVYLKGKGQLKDYPWLAKKELEKEGITKDRIFISESVSEIKYTRPNKFEERVIAVYSSGGDRNTSPNAYVFGSFYQPEIAETVSPLSPKAFSYYRFEYLGSFKDREYEVTKIKVTPRSKGDNIFEGVIYIVEDWWSIHSLDMKATKVGINFHIKQIYTPIEGKAWLPISQNFVVGGRVFGFEFEGQYLATVKDYKITLNPDLIVEMTVIDENIQKEEAKAIEQKHSQKGMQIQERLADGKEVTRKELSKLIKEYEKQELKEQKEPTILSDTKYSVDSLAYKKDSLFWVEMRPTPLTKEEQRGYHKNDSMTEVQRKREEGDTLKPSKNKGFQVLDLLRGDSYKVGKTSNLIIHTPFGGFNTVEGYNLIYRLSFSKRWVRRDSISKELSRKVRVSSLTISPIARYAFSRETFSGILRADYRSPNRRLIVEGGRYIRQFNGNDPIHPVVNTLTTLLLERNLMKIYERDFVELNYRQRFNDKYTLRANWSFAQRSELFNNTSYKWVNRDKEAYTVNAPVNIELPMTGFTPHQAMIGAIGVDARPWLKYRMRNGNKFRIDGSSPLLTFDYKKGFGDVLGSDVQFDQVEVGFKYGFRMGIRGKLDVAMQAGKFLNTDRMFFMDYKHFLGNLTPIITTDPVGSFRLLDYYQNSTQKEYFTANVHYHFRKFLVTRFPLVRVTGITENVFVNYLATPYARNYTEVGYSLDGILRIFRLEAAASFVNGNYQTYGFRLGIATSITGDSDSVNIRF